MPLVRVSNGGTLENADNIYIMSGGGSVPNITLTRDYKMLIISGYAYGSQVRQSVVSYGKLLCNYTYKRDSTYVACYVYQDVPAQTINSAQGSMYCFSCVGLY